MGKYYLRPVGLLQLPLKSVTAGEPLVEEGNLNAALFSNLLLGEKVKRRVFHQCA